MEIPGLLISKDCSYKLYEIAEDLILGKEYILVSKISSAKSREISMIIDIDACAPKLVFIANFLHQDGKEEKEFELRTILGLPFQIHYSSDWVCLITQNRNKDFKIAFYENEKK